MFTRDCCRLILCVTGSVFFSPFIYSQTNLVPNGSFEIYTVCPEHENGNPWQNDLIANVPGWHTSWQTPDYYNACATFSYDDNPGVPLNNLGYQEAYDGIAYCGFGIYAINGPARETISAELTSPLVIGKQYSVSFRVNLADQENALYAINKIGAFFSTNAYTVYNFPSTGNFAHVYTNTIIDDRENWTLVYGCFYADSAYNHVQFGNFFDDSHLDVLTLGIDYDQHGISYYFIDDVQVYEDSACVPQFIPAPNVEVPNVITPNSSPGINDFFEIDNLPDGSSCTIFNRWGEIVFHSDHYNNAWDGVNQLGNRCTEGVYYYIINLPSGEPLAGFLSIF